MLPPVILKYHSVDDRNGRSDVWNLSVSPDNFVSQIEALVSERMVVPLEELGRCVGAGRVPAGHVVITFDDGYANNLAIAKPVLERYDAPATLFLMTAAMDSLGFWWDRLERTVMEADFLPTILYIPLPDRTLEIAIEGVDRTHIFLAIWSRLRELDADHRDMAVSYMASVLGVQRADPALRPLTTDEVQQLDHGILSVGAHTHRHLRLPQLGPAELIREIVDSKAICENLLDTRVTAFSYPFGDYDDRVQVAVAEAGLTLACTMVPRSIQSDDHCLALPSIAVGNWTGDQLIRSLPAGDNL